MRAWRLLTFDSLGKILKYLQSAGNDLRPALPDRLWHNRGIYLQQRAQGCESKLLVVHAGQPVICVDGLKPLVEEQAGSAGANSFHDVQSCSRVVQHAVDEDLQVGETQRGGLDVVNEVEGGGDDDLETL